MQKFVRICFLLFLSALMMITVTACKLPEKDDPSIVYDTDTAFSPQMYTSFINKQIEPVTNVFVSQMGLADKVCDSEYPIQDAITSAITAVETIDTSIKGVDNMFPPVKYTSLRDDVLKELVNAKNTVETYLYELEQPYINSAKIKSCRDLMEGDFIALTSLFNVYNQ